VSAARYLLGDVRDVLAQLPDGSIDLVLTSPPFLALRSYLPDDHPDKAKEIGTETTPGEFIDTLLDVVEAVRPKLAEHGSIAVELGDTYSGSGGAGGDYAAGGLREGQQAFSGSASKSRKVAPRKVVRPNGCDTDSTPPQRLPVTGGEDWPLDKSMTLVPELFRLSLAYGVNPLTGREVERWRVRNNIRWCRPNPPVGRLGDKFRPGTSDMAIATISRTRYFDLDAVRTGSDADEDPGGPPLDWWEVPSEPYAGSHYATWPTALLTRPILAMTPARVCTTCGEPSRRIVETKGTGRGFRRNREEGNERGGSTTDAPDFAERTTVGWTDCGHDTWRRGVVLDPFAGSGTTLAVATGHGRDAWGIDLDERNVDLARERVGMFLEVEDLRPSSRASA
jgi:site-specific DNA-methyltransferase (adenine-specific)